MNKMINNKIGDLLVIIAGVCWGLIGIFTRKLGGFGLDSIQITFLRNLFAAIMLLVIVIFKDRKSICIKIKDIWMFCGTGILSIAFFNVCYFKVIELASLSVAAILLYTAPAMVMIMSCIFFKEKFTRKKTVALIMAFTGCVFTTGILEGTERLSISIIIIGLLSGFGYALYSIFGTWAIRKYNSFTVSLYTFFFAFISLIPLCDVKATVNILLGNHTTIWISIGLAAVSTIVPFLCYTAGLKRMEAGKASIMAFIEPLVAALCGILIFNEKVSISNVIGIVFIFLSVIILNIREKS